MLLILTRRAVLSLYFLAMLDKVSPCLTVYSFVYCSLILGTCLEITGEGLLSVSATVGVGVELEEGAGLLIVSESS